MSIKHINYPKTLSKQKKESGDRKTTSIADILPYLPPPPKSFFADVRHLAYDTTDGILPFSLTTRISSACMQYLFEYSQIDNE